MSSSLSAILSSSQSVRFGLLNFQILMELHSKHQIYVVNDNLSSGQRRLRGSIDKVHRLWRLLWGSLRSPPHPCQSTKESGKSTLTLVFCNHISRSQRLSQSFKWRSHPHLAFSVFWWRGWSWQWRSASNTSLSSSHMIGHPWRWFQQTNNRKWDRR